MNQRIELIIWFITAMVVSLLVLVNVLKGGLFDYATAILLVSPFLFVGFIRTRKWWHILPFLLIPLSRFSIPLAALRSVTPVIIFLVALGITSILDRAMAKGAGRPAFSTLGGKFLLLYSLIMTLRFAYDRPGFVGLGAEHGGFIHAFQYVLAGWAFFFVEPAVRRGVFTRRQLWAVAAAASVGLAWMAVDILLVDRRIWYQEMAGAPSWVLCAALLPLLMESPLRSHRNMLLPAIAFFAVLGVVTRHRTRLLFLMGEIFLVAWLGKRFIRIFITFVIASTIVGIGLFILGGGRLPGTVLRALSLFIPTDTLFRYDAQPGIYGWRDSFRVDLFRLAWINIKLNPFFGRGLAVDVAEAISILAGSRLGAHEALLAISAGYHNTFINMAVGAGVPAALFYVLANIVIVVRFIPWARRCKETGYKEWSYAILAYWYANMMMILVNGSQIEGVHCAIALAYMVGLMNNEELKRRAMPQEPDRPDMPPPEAALPPTPYVGRRAPAPMRNRTGGPGYRPWQ